MEKKVLEANGYKFEFLLDEQSNIWRTIQTPYLIEGQSIDLEIDLANFTNALNWEEIVKFIVSIKSNNKLRAERIGDAKEVLKTLFKSINRNVYDEDFFNHLDFNLTGIDFRGRCKNVNLSHQFEYDYFFFPHYTKDPYRDIGAFVWRANFREALLLGVYCDRI
jgi:hypothetical protein